MDLSSIQIPATFALAVIAAFGYLVGRRAGKNRDELAARSERDLRQSVSVAREMDKISRSLRRSVARYQGSLKADRERAGQLGNERQEPARALLPRETEQTLDPSIGLAMQIVGACNTNGQATDPLTTVAEVGTDPSAGDSGRADPHDQLITQFTMLARHGSQDIVVVTPPIGLEETSGSAERMSLTNWKPEFIASSQVT